MIYIRQTTRISKAMTFKDTFRYNKENHSRTNIIQQTFSLSCIIRLWWGDKNKLKNSSVPENLLEAWQKENKAMMDMHTEFNGVMPPPGSLRGFESCGPAHERDRNRGVDYTGVATETNADTINKQGLTTSTDTQTSRWGFWDNSTENAK